MHVLSNEKVSTPYEMFNCNMYQGSFTEREEKVSL